ncbi:hypothetical protein O181_032568 [Austropuccinia psidii MF-1]|uniref:Uncharacterized protein n=1 Tax=Austropuccinia psidii MF-1 TaxID=1389203 RepID=A0A9Q3D1V3_9BASI|nr:hypothetical protein [Austropuccinia psidii MF-1]
MRGRWDPMGLLSMVMTQQGGVGQAGDGKSKSEENLGRVKKESWDLPKGSSMDCVRATSGSCSRVRTSSCGLDDGLRPGIGGSSIQEGSTKGGTVSSLESKVEIQLNSGCFLRNKSSNHWVPLGPGVGCRRVCSRGKLETGESCRGGFGWFGSMCKGKRHGDNWPKLACPLAIAILHRPDNHFASVKG